MSKYHARKTAVDGIVFDSKKEAARYCELKLLEAAGKIGRLELQPCFELQPGYVHNGKKIRPIEYRADFRYITDGCEVVEDVKGLKTEVYKLKKKMLLYRYPDLRFLET